MITINTLYTIQILQGLSTDTKPVDGVTNGSIFVEIDTARKWRFDKENEMWLDYDNPQQGGDNVVIYTKYDTDNSTTRGYKDANMTPFTSVDDAKTFIGNNSVVCVDLDNDDFRIYPVVFQVATNPEVARLDCLVYHEGVVWTPIYLYEYSGS